jgi:hypothetical protein
MMRLALALVLLLFASVGTASAECAWVTWMERWGTIVDMTPGRVSLKEVNYGDKKWTLVSAFDDRQSCERQVGLQIEAHSKKLKTDAAPGRTETVEVQGNVVIRSVGKGETSARTIDSYRFLCLSDTIDPRGPKAK